MSLSCSTTCIKYLLFLFNLIFVITGIIFISVGVSVKDHYNNYDTFIDEHYLFAPEFLIGIGILIFIISFFGCCGSIRENACCTLTFSTLLLLIFFLEVAAGVSGYFLKNTTRDYLSKKLIDSMQHYNDKNYTDITVAWDHIQRDFKCCGVKNPEDWLKANTTEYLLPNSCCDPIPGIIGALDCNVNSTNLHEIGCLDAFGQFIKTHSRTIEAAGLGIAFVQFIGIILSCYLSSQIRKGYQTV